MKPFDNIIKVLKEYQDKRNFKKLRKVIRLLQQINEKEGKLNLLECEICKENTLKWVFDNVYICKKCETLKTVENLLDYDEDQLYNSNEDGDIEKGDEDE